MRETEPRGEAVPFFSVIIPTRNRPDSCREAIDSVLSQSFAALEVIVVDDGSAPENRTLYDRLAAELGTRVKWFHQPARENGHGPSYSINSGAGLASGRYLCLLDDDDSWIDPQHLARVHRVITGLEDRVDAYYSNQRAVRPDGEELAPDLWLSPLAWRLPPDRPGEDQVYLVNPEFLLSCKSFPHPNCTILRRAFFRAIGGMDESIRYECEVDLYLRCLDRADGIVYDPHYVARHNVPDRSLRPSVSTAVTAIGKRLSQIQVYQKSLVGASRACVQQACRQRLALVYKKLAGDLRRTGRGDAAALLSSVVPAFDTSWKWRFYSLYLRVIARWPLIRRSGRRERIRPGTARSGAKPAHQRIHLP